MDKLKSIDWEELIRVSLMGTDRLALPEKILAHFSAIGVDLDQSTEKILLSGLSKSAFVLSAGRVFPKEEISNEVPNYLSTLAPCPAPVAAMLPKVLAEEKGVLFKEYSKVLQQRKWEFPTSALPELLNKALEEPAFWYSIREEIGPRAFWLIKQNKDWSSLSPKTSGKSINFRNNQQRISYFLKERSANNKVEFSLLQPWSNFSLKEKIQLLQIIIEHSRAEDLEFLNINYPTKGKALIILFQKALAKHEFSDFVQVRIKALGNYIFVKNNKLKVELPTTDDSSEFDFLGQHPDFPGGLRANYFAQFLSVIPFSEIEKLFQRKPEEIIALVLKDEWNSQFISAFIQQTMISKSPDWNLALLKAWQLYPKAVDWPSLQIRDLIPLLPAFEFEAFVLWAGQFGIKTVDVENAYTDTLLLYSHPWPNAVTFSFFKLVKVWLKKNPRFWEGWYIWQILKQAAYQVDATQYPLLQKAFNTDGIWVLAEDEIGNFLDIVRFRTALYLNYNEQEKK